MLSTAKDGCNPIFGAAVAPTRPAKQSTAPRPHPDPAANSPRRATPDRPPVVAVGIKRIGLRRYTISDTVKFDFLAALDLGDGGERVVHVHDELLDPDSFRRFLAVYHGLFLIVPTEPAWDELLAQAAEAGRVAGPDVDRRRDGAQWGAAA